jgi:electron transfer flavoprotein alpha subunit
MANENGILIVAEVADGQFSPVGAELLGAARRLAGELKQPVYAALLGSGVEGLAQEAIAFGADKVFLAEDPLLAEYNTDTHTAAMQKVCAEANPSVVLLGQTNTGRDLAPRLAFRLGTAVAMDCIELGVDSGKLLMTRPCYGGSAQAIYTCKTMPQMATVRAKSQEPLERDASRSGEVVKVETGLDASVLRAKVVERKKAEAEGIRLEDAEVIVSGGRGIGSTEGFAALEELAQVLGGAVGATRAACDLGWRPVADQIGLTGKVVSPTLYIAVAISGASQHMTGCSGSKNIVAINKDAEAGIFKASRFGIVGDYKQVMPALLEACRKLTS